MTNTENVSAVKTLKDAGLSLHLYKQFKNKNSGC